LLGPASMKHAGLLCLVVVGVACGSSPPQGFSGLGSGSGSGGSSGGSSSGGGSSGGSSSGSGLLGDGGLGMGGDDGGIPSNCASGAGTFIYVISEENNLYTFDPTMFPSASAFTEVGPVTCDSSGVNSMAVDRSATAWVNFNSGSIYKVTTTAPVTCTPTNFVSGQAGFTGVLGMGFSVDTAGGNSETLFVSDNGGPGGTCNATTPSAGCTGLGLGTIDTTTMTLTALGAYTSTAAGYNAELTGTGDAKLYGFFTTTPSSYGEIDKTNGQTSAPAPTSLSTVTVANGGYAFSFWGGDFYFYTAPNDQTVVTHLQTSTGMTTDSPELTFTIVGAGVSTCAPIVPPVPH
jgi:hypothetical protein